MAATFNIIKTNGGIHRDGIFDISELQFLNNSDAIGSQKLDIQFRESDLSGRIDDVFGYMDVTVKHGITAIGNYLVRFIVGEPQPIYMIVNIDLNEVIEDGEIYEIHFEYKLI